MRSHQTWLLQLSHPAPGLSSTGQPLHPQGGLGTTMATQHRAVGIQHMQNSLLAWYHRSLYSGQNKANSSSVFSKPLGKKSDSVSLCPAASSGREDVPVGLRLLKETC